MTVVQTVGRSVYGHVIAEFSRMYRFSKLWGSAENTELRRWSNKISAENLKKYVISLGKKNEPAIQSGDDGQRML